MGTHSYTRTPPTQHNSVYQPLSPWQYVHQSACLRAARCAAQGILVYYMMVRIIMRVYLSSSPPPGSCSICSPAPSPAPSRKLCADSPLRVRGGNPKQSSVRRSHLLPRPGRPPPSPYPSPASLRGQVTALTLSRSGPPPATDSARCRVPLTQRSL